jgi:putative aldouronate transport system permease protein
VPFLVIIGTSFSDEQRIIREGFTIIPRGFTLDAYKIALTNPQKLLGNYAVTIFVTIVGSSIAVFLMSMTAYVIHKKDFKWADHLSFFLYFTTLFNGGLVPFYILYLKLGLRDNLLALILPYMFNVFFIIVLKSFMKNVPAALNESARIDGANEFVIFTHIYLPVSKPAIATILLFTGLIYWNDWFMCMLFIRKTSIQNLQYTLHMLISSAEALKTIVSEHSGVQVSTRDLPTETLKMTMTLLVTLPIMLLYPFLQKYFVQGLTVGAVKG